ncbi:MAG: endonuclease III [Verrucomicrobia bacterium 21-51-4]|nr:MAG: endonuclease III [Verrucomicrobia bacterium 21-51-4]HQU09651.1 endonuclease III [Opitutales bacterium]
MKKQDRASYIQQRLAQLFPNPQPALDHKTPYTLLIAVLLSARCTDAMVNRVTPSLFALADTPEMMARLPVEQVQSIIRPCGLSPAKAKAIVGLSQILLEKHGGEVPQDFDALENLPGVGHKTASVVRVQAFRIPAFPVDTHVYRLARAWKLSTHKSIARVEEDLKSLFPPEAWHDVHLQMVYYGRTYCPARRCDGLQCLLCQECFCKTAGSKADNPS